MHPTPVRSVRKTWLLIAAVGVVVVLGALICCLPIGRFSDDYLLLHDRPDPGFFHHFTVHYPYSPFYYRPLMLVFTHAVQYLWGREVWPIHLVHLLLHLGLCLLVYRAARRLELGERAAAIAALLTLGSQIVVLPVLSVDTFCQMTSTLAGWASVFLLYRALWNEARRSRRILLFTGSLLCLLVALFCRENALGFVPAAAVVITASLFAQSRKEGKANYSRLLLWVPYLAATAFYIVLRQSCTLPPPLVKNFGIGWHLLLHPIQLAAGALSPLSTETFIGAYQRGDWLLVIVGGLMLAALASGVVYGLLRSKRRGLILVLALLTLTSFVPHAMLFWISELYAYNSLPVLALLTALGLDTLWNRTSVARRPFLGVALAFLFAVNVFGIVQKAELMRQNAGNAASLLEQLKPYNRSQAAGSTLYLVNPPDPGPSYSIFRIYGFRLIADSTPYLPFPPRRYDYRVWIGDREELPAVNPAAGDTVLTLEPENWLVVPFEDGP
jgi:hypothetical protein